MIWIVLVIVIIVLPITIMIPVIWALRSLAIRMLSAIIRSSIMLVSLLFFPFFLFVVPFSSSYHPSPSPPLPSSYSSSVFAAIVHFILF